MKVLLFTHKNDIDGMGNAVLANLAFDEVEYVLCGTFDLVGAVSEFYDDGSIYQYDKIFVTDLCLQDPILSKIASDKDLEGKILNFDHHKTFMDEKYTRYPFIKVQMGNDKGLCCGTSLFYEYLTAEGLIDKDDISIKEFVELTRQHDTWEWRTIYNNEKARHLATLFDAIGPDGYIDFMTRKLKSNETKKFEFDSFEEMLIDNRLKLIDEKLKIYSKQVIYREILGLKAGIVFMNTVMNLQNILDKIILIWILP